MSKQSKPNLDTGWKNEFTIPTHDPYTGELNPYYEELTGKKNPLVDPDLVIKIEPRMIREDFNRGKDLDKMPNQKWHQIMSFFKSTVRIIGYCFIPFNLVIATTLLVFSELIGIIEELV